ncbi:MAG: PDZ domain-containing protein, partial [Clostridia bacterium]|nr:PDZ domain-containing protein [Clostridia bacterium]
IGVNSAKTVIASYDENGEAISAEGLGFAIPINTALETARAIIENGSIVRPGIGISTIVIDEDTAAKYDIPVGALVYSILEDGPGHLAGLHVDDIIIKADDTDIPDSESLGRYISTKSLGDVVKLTVFRDGETITIDITIGDLNQLGSTVLNDEYGGEKYGLR